MGTIICEVTEQAISPSRVFAFAQGPTHGAQTFFFGSVRDKNAGRDVTAVSYDSAPILAEHTLKEIAEEAILKWDPSLRIAVFHRIGTLSVGEISVAIGVSSPHRAEAYLASRYIIEQIKIRVPIWKKEFYTDGESQWLKGHALCQHSQGGLESECC